MKRTWVLWALLAAPLLGAQTAPAPELVLDVNAESDLVAARGWPLLIRVVAISADGQGVNLTLQSGAWTQALSLTVTDQKGNSQNWPVQLVQPAGPAVILSGTRTAEAVWLVAPADTANILAGVYNLSVTLNTTTTAASGAWSGSVASTGAAVTLQAEPLSLAAEDEASKYLAFAAYARLRGDTQGVGSALDTLMAHQPSILQAYVEKGDLLSSTGDFAGARALYQQALDQFLAANPNVQEPLTLFTRKIDAASTRLAAADNGVTAVAPNCISTVFAADSIVNAYGTSFAIASGVASGSPPTTLGGTTVTITDSAGVSVPAPLFYVSAAQVNFLAPAGLAAGTATVVVKSGDGTTQHGTATIAAVVPALFTLNGDGLIAGGILRVTADGQQVYQNPFAVDGTGSIVAAPVDLSKDQVYLTLYGTGLHHAAQGDVKVSVGGVNVPVLYAGTQGFFVGLDQINVQLPPSLAGKGEVTLVVTAAGMPSNRARITLQ